MLDCFMLGNRNPSLLLCHLDMGKSLIKFQIGPVQDFIAAARSTRDLWSGSYLLSFLVAAGMRKLQSGRDTLVFPDAEGQPLLVPEEWQTTVQARLLTPNLPNLFVAEVPTENAVNIANNIEAAIRDEWKKIAKAVWKNAVLLGIDTGNGREDGFLDVLKKHLSIAWQITPIGNESDAYAEAYAKNGWHLDSVRQTRDFRAASSGYWKTGTEKDSLTGREDAICGGTDFAENMKKKNGEIFSLFKHSDHIGPLSLVKRTWHLAYLAEKQKLKSSSKDFKIRSIPAIAARTGELDDERSGEPIAGEKYIAAIAFDGDSIGKWISGELLPAGTNLRNHHTAFSKALGNFASIKVREIVEKPISVHNKHGNTKEVLLGQLIYAGGDDVLALVPGDAALECAAALRKAFCDATIQIKGTEKGKEIHPDASAGIAIAHVNAPLQDLIREAQKAEKHAKNTIGRPAFSVTLMKRSGEISRWGGKWDNSTEKQDDTTGALPLYQKVASLLVAEDLSAKFPHRVCALLEPYVISHTPLTELNKTLQDAPDFSAYDIITREFDFAISRQSAPQKAQENKAVLAPLLDTYLKAIAQQREAWEAERKDFKQSAPQGLLTAIIGLCTTVAFTHRTRRETKTSATPQPAQA